MCDTIDKQESIEDDNTEERRRVENYLGVLKSMSRGFGLVNKQIFIEEMTKALDLLEYDVRRESLKAASKYEDDAPIDTTAGEGEKSSDEVGEEYYATEVISTGETDRPTINFYFECVKDIPTDFGYTLQEIISSCGTNFNIDVHANITAPRI